MEESNGDPIASALAAALDAFRRCPELICVVDLEGRLVSRNQAFVGRAPSAKAASELFPEESRAAFASALHHVLRAGDPRGFEWGDTVADGVRRWFSASVAPIELEATVVGAIIISRDITALKQSEDRLRRSEQLMVDTQGVAHLGTWEWDISQPHATWSSELYRIYGLTPETYTPSYDVYLTMVHPDDRQRVIDATNRVFHEHVPYSHDERIYRPDGSIRYLHTWAHPVLDQNGKLQRLVGVCQDITDRMQAEEAVRLLNSELEQRVSERTQQLQIALRDLETFNSMVSHDLRSPLTVIDMAVQLIEQERELPAKVTPLIARIRRAISNMSQLVSDLLTFARVGHEALRLASIDGSALCREIVAEHQQTSTDREVDVHIESGLDLHVDPTLFRAALANLIGNAWKYTARTDSPRIEIGAAQRTDGRALYVRDNGIGFDMKQHDQLFRPFTRLANASDFTGTGLGLATVERVVERHGGTVRAEGELGQGATFFLLLPDTAWG